MPFAAARRDGEESRARILAAVAADPGVHVSEIVERTSLSWHTVAYHLRILALQRLVESDKAMRERRVFPAGVPPMQRAWLAALRNERAADVLRLLLEDPKQGISSLSRRMGFSEKIVRRQIAHLAEAGLIERRGEMRPVYELAPAAAPRLAHWMREQGRGVRDIERDSDGARTPMDERPE